MKNLNRKLSVIALSGMAVFGGVAASGVQAFAAPREIELADEVSDPIIEEINGVLKDLLVAFRVVKVVNDKSEARQELRSGIYPKASNSIISVKKQNDLSRVLNKVIRGNNFRYHSFGLSYQGKCYIIQVKNR